MKEGLEKVIEFAFEHSTTRAFLIFSGILVIFSMGYAKEFIPVVFFTLFYAFVVYRILVLRKTEVWGNYAVGDTLGALLYFVIDLLFFVSWVVGSVLLLSGVHLLNLLSYFQFGIFFWSALIMFVSWLVLIFWRAVKEERKNPPSSK